jgi:hypothetical protein
LRSSAWAWLLGAGLREVASRGRRPIAAGKQRVAVSQPALNATGTSSTPGVFELAQMGFVGFRCDRNWRVQPFFDVRGAVAAEEVTVEGGRLTGRNFTRRVVGHDHGKPVRETRFSAAQRIALPFAHYHTVVFTLHQGTEARILDAKVMAQFVSDTGKDRATAWRVFRQALARVDERFLVPRCERVPALRPHAQSARSDLRVARLHPVSAWRPSPNSARRAALRRPSSRRAMTPSQYSYSVATAV